MQEVQEVQVQPLDWEAALEKGMVTHSSILAWRVPWTEEPGGLHTVHGVTKSWTQLNQFSVHTHTHTHTHAHMHTHTGGQWDSPRGDGLKSVRAVLPATVATPPCAPEHPGVRLA